MNLYIIHFKFKKKQNKYNNLLWACVAAFERNLTLIEDNKI